MTPKQLTIELTPTVREAAERAKPELIASMGPIERQLLKAAWKGLMTYAVPFLTRVALELFIGKYREILEPIVGKIIADILPLLSNTDPNIQKVKGFFEMLQTPINEFHPAVQACLDPVIGHNPVDYVTTD